MRNVGDRQRDDFGALSRAGQPAALDPRQVLADDVHLADRRARTQQRAVDLLLLRERNALDRCDPVRRTAAGQQHQQQIVRGRLGRKTQRVVGGFQPGLIGHGVAGLDHPDPPRRHAMAVARGGDAGQPCRVEPERVEIMPLGSCRHRGRALAGGEADHPAFRRRAQMRRQHDVRMRGRDGRIEDRTQEGTPVGHVCTGAKRTGSQVIHPIAAKENPRGMPAGALLASNRPISILRLAADVAASMTSPKRSQASPLNFCSWTCRNRGKVGSAGVDLDAWQQAAESRDS